MNRYQKGMKVLCKIPAITRQNLICTVQKQVDDKTLIIDLPCTIKGFKTVSIDSSSIIEILPPPAQKIEKKPPPAPEHSTYGRLKKRLMEMATDQPYRPPPEEPPPAPIIESKPASNHNMQSSCIFDLISIDDLTEDEIKLMKQLQEENK